MDVLIIIGGFLTLWGIATLWVGVFKPKRVWEIDKIQGFVQLLTETGTQVFFAVIGLAAIVGGLLILF